jgi:ferredoxin
LEDALEADISGQIAGKAGELFDVLAVRRDTGGVYLLVLGLESTPERNLDDFGHSGGFHMYGFEEYVAPLLEKLVGFIRDRGFSAEPAGRYGYPLEGKINLKEMAVRAGIGRRGKNTVVLHPEYGPRLRFIAVRTDAPLGALVGADRPDEESQACRDCSVCIDICPVSALEPFRMPDPSICLSNVTPLDDAGRSILCDECLKQCPA